MNLIEAHKAKKLTLLLKELPQVGLAEITSHLDTSSLVNLLLCGDTSLNWRLKNGGVARLAHFGGPETYDALSWLLSNFPALEDLSLHYTNDKNAMYKEFTWDRLPPKLKKLETNFPLFLYHAALQEDAADSVPAELKEASGAYYWNHTTPPIHVFNVHTASFVKHLTSLSGGFRIYDLDHLPRTLTSLTAFDYGNTTVKGKLPANLSTLEMTLSPGFKDWKAIFLAVPRLVKLTLKVNYLFFFDTTSEDWASLPRGLQRLDWSVLLCCGASSREKDVADEEEEDGVEDAEERCIKIFKSLPPSLTWMSTTSNKTICKHEAALKYLPSTITIPK